MRPRANDYDPAFNRYIDLVPEDDVVAALEAQGRETYTLLTAIGEERSRHRYADGKWTIKGVIGHVGDGERIFGYRALAIARGETEPLPPFDEELYAETARFDSVAFEDLVEQLTLVRRSHVLLFRSFDEETWNRRGVANNRATIVSALAYTMLGHERHHLRVLRERYGV